MWQARALWLPAAIYSKSKLPPVVRWPSNQPAWRNSTQHHWRKHWEGLRCCDSVLVDLSIAWLSFPVFVVYKVDGQLQIIFSSKCCSCKGCRSSLVVNDSGVTPRSSPLSSLKVMVKTIELRPRVIEFGTLWWVTLRLVWDCLVPERQRSRPHGSKLSYGLSLPIVLPYFTDIFRKVMAGTSQRGTSQSDAHVVHEDARYRV